MTNHDEQMKAVARLVSGRPDWIDAPAVQAWHRSDGRTEHDGTPGKPRIWSPDYRTTERWSTPSLQNVHWSDLMDVVPLAAPAGSYARTDEDTPEQYREVWQAAESAVLDERAMRRKAERERDEARKFATAEHDRATEAEWERDEARGALRARLGVPAESRPLTPDAITDEMIDRSMDVYIHAEGSPRDAWRAALTAALTEPPARPEGAYELETVIGCHAGKWTSGAEDVRALADLLASKGVRATEAE